MLTKRDEGGELRLPEEPVDSSFDDLTVGLTDVAITRSRAIKLAGAALAGSALTLLWPAEADARRRRKKKRRRRKKVTATPNPANFGSQEDPVPVGTSLPQTVSVTNHQDTEPVYVTLSPEALNGGFTFAPGFDASAPILPGTTVDVPLVFTPTTPGVHTGDLVISAAPDASGNPLKVVDLTGTAVTASV